MPFHRQHAVGLVVAAAMLASPASALAQSAEALLARDVAKAADSPLTGRYTGSVLIAQTVKAFDALTLPTGPAQGRRYQADKKFAGTIALQGQVTRSIYVAPKGRSALEVISNFEQPIVGNGFSPVFQCAADCGESFPLLKYRWDSADSKVVAEGYERPRIALIEAAFGQLVDVRYGLFKKAGPAGDTYVAIYGGLHQGAPFGRPSEALRDRVGVLVEIVEPREMEKRMEVVSAADIGGKVAAEGRAVFYGILFDFDKADIKPESEPQLAEMGKFLKANPGTRVYVIGHTDNKGTLDYNLGLSQRRAEAVAKALQSRYGIEAKRLTPRGLGPLAPVASNRSEAGQARNRRVEMVEQ